MWDGVRNTAALKHMRAMRVDDEALIYHTGKERRIVGMAQVTRSVYVNPNLPHATEGPPLLVVDIRALRWLPQPVTLAAIKADATFADFALVRQPRLSVMPVDPTYWQKILQMSDLA
jgi:predicted RNA-binding protein with PUA-like domain